MREKNQTRNNMSVSMNKIEFTLISKNWRNAELLILRENSIKLAAAEEKREKYLVLDEICW